MKVVFADVDNGLMLKKKEKKKLSFRKLSENILENILGTNGRKIVWNF